MISEYNEGGDVPAAVLVQSPDKASLRFSVVVSFFGFSTHKLPAFEDYTLTDFV